MQRKIKFYSLLFGRIIFATLLLSISIGSYAQLSPGDLSEAHAHLEGLSNCTECHTLGEKIDNSKCLDCHKEIQQRITQNKGYHSSNEVKGKTCISCHSDHHGRKFDMIHFNKDQFNHDLAGYVLEEAHAKLKCEACHKNEFIKNSDIKKKKKTFLGLETSCLSCHQDYHQKTLSSDCFKCHDFKAFKPAPKFDHINTKFQLTGRHAEIECIDCHKKTTKENKEFQEFAGIKHQSCTNCHKDVHNNKFGQDCKQCHNNISFLQINNQSGFDHNKTDYPLRGKHLNLDCKKCHKQKLTDPLPHNHCYSCHEDYHKGQFNKPNKKSDCKDCHDVNGFMGSKFSIEQHNESVFPLKGAHIATPCFVCHLKEDKWTFREIGQKCKDCHNNIHQSFIDIKYYPEENCKNCHSEESWSQIQFDHKKTEYDLKGSHQKVSCRDCHFYQSEEGKVTQKFNNIKPSCVECHLDIHQQQFANKEGQTTCEKCHDFKDWKKPSLFDHNKASFALDGKHQKVACKECHYPVSKNETTYILYKTNKIRCEDCH